MSILNILDNSKISKVFGISVSLIIYKIILDFVYYYYIHPTYNYEKMSLDFILQKYIIASLAFLFLLRWIVLCYKTDKGVSNKICLVVNWIYFIPMCTLYPFMGLPDAFFLFFFLSWFLYLFFQNNIKSFTIHRYESRFSKSLFYFILYFFLFFTVFVAGYYNHFRLQFSLIDVYDNRFAAREIQMPLIVKYLQGFANIFFPIITVYCLINKKRLLFIFVLIAAFFNFSFGAHKSAAFSVILAIFVYFYYKPNRFNWMPNMISLIGVLSLIGIGGVIVDLLFYRMIFLPNLITYWYFDFFSSNELLFLRESIFSRLAFDMPYDLPSNFKISEVYVNNSEINANQGLAGDSFANFGWWSLLIYPFMWVLLAKYFEALTKEIDNRLSIITAIMISLQLISGTFFSILLTGGVFFAFFLFYIMPTNMSLNRY